METRRRNYFGETQSRSNEKTECMLSGLIRYVKCGAAFTGLYRSNKRGYKHRYYGCSNKQNRKGCDAKNMNADDLESLIYYTLKNEILNDNIIERTADAIIAEANTQTGTKKDRRDGVKKEIADVTFQINNLLKVLLSGFDSDAVRDKVKELEIRKKTLEQTGLIRQAPVTREIDREKLIEQLKKDTYVLLNEPGKTRELIRKYVVKIIISDTTVEVIGISDIKEEPSTAIMDGYHSSGKGT
jgi:site-specific DNA recombinase